MILPTTVRELADLLHQLQNRTIRDRVLEETVHAALCTARNDWDRKVATKYIQVSGCRYTLPLY